ncbi:helix-turn-helix domain-containing protein [Marinitenerispora sediminis]|uniref:XRE family transcriptional regulator n=1 Tax=Marinitenerispora sediminis TaxID=1931232 RepID=A0A368T569_9ACTN|nr:helix-turn-helix domain-containing protein [Marinitenerispora sediminis]RCV49828.1 XRE family transcriptional regulator [Marinitenerispora sediminis]RCV53926.1 XRE family transcriptional regulator [Marinitenerispora sediminis]RCV58398.1 XRE family transcriptional regulator [Marinitenerispora sediminis]
MNDALRQALAASRLTDADVAARVGVDPKTVRRWLAGKTPYPRHRWAVADLLGVPERRLWPEIEAPELPRSPRTSHGHVYPHRWAVPHEAWRELFASAEREIGVLVYAGLFLADDPGILRIFEEKARGGVSVRILLGDPDSPQVRQRGEEEEIGDAMPAKIRNALVLYRPLLSVDGIEIRLHDTVLYNSIYRADDRLLINQHIYGAPASMTPVLYIDSQTSNDVADLYLQSFERTWQTATPYDP